MSLRNAGMHEKTIQLNFKSISFIRNQFASQNRSPKGDLFILGPQLVAWFQRLNLCYLPIQLFGY